MIEKTSKGWQFVEPQKADSVDHDSEYWMKMSLEAKWTASWEMTVLRHFMKGGTADGLKMDKSKFWIGPIEEGEARDRDWLD